MGKLRGQPLLVGVCALALTAVGCGSEDHPNEPRPPAPIELSALIEDRKVTLDPHNFGAGLANITISNQSDDVARLTIEGERAETASAPLQPNSVTTIKFEFAEGEYEVSAGSQSSAEPQQVNVGPERPSAQNELLLP